ncbi:MAG: flagellar motor protein MotB [Vicinamibacterales bacterium]
MTPRRTRQSPVVSRDRWLLSYADFITLLFAFFTTLYAASNVDAAHWATVAAGVGAAFDQSRAHEQPGKPSMISSGVLPGGRGIVGDGDGDARSALERELGDVLQATEVHLTNDRRGLVLSIPEAGAFPVGGSDLSPAAEQFMRRLATALGRVSNAVRIEGHTDDTPIHTARFASNWELSTARATSVVEFLVEQGGIDPARLSAAGYAEFHPRGPNDGAEGRARNRRVDIIVLNGATQATEEPGVGTTWERLERQP